MAVSDSNVPWHQTVKANLRCSIYTYAFLGLDKWGQVPAAHSVFSLWGQGWRYFLSVFIFLSIWVYSLIYLTLMLISSTKPFSGDSDNASLLRWNYYAVDDFNTTELRAFCDFLEYIVLATSSFYYATWIRTHSLIHFLPLRKWSKNLLGILNQALEKRTDPWWNAKTILELHLSSVSAGYSVYSVLGTDSNPHCNWALWAPSTSPVSISTETGFLVHFRYVELEVFLSNSCGLLKASGASCGLTAAILSSNTLATPCAAPNIGGLCLTIFQEATTLTE